MKVLHSAIAKSLTTLEKEIPKQIGIFGKVHVGKDTLLHEIIHQSKDNYSVTKIVDLPRTEKEIELGFQRLEQEDNVFIRDTEENQTVILVVDPFDDVNEFDVEFVNQMQQDSDLQLLLFFNYFASQEQEERVFMDTQNEELELRIQEIETQLNFDSKNNRYSIVSSLNPQESDLHAPEIQKWLNDCVEEIDISFEENKENQTQSSMFFPFKDPSKIAFLNVIEANANKIMKFDGNLKEDHFIDIELKEENKDQFMERIAELKENGCELIITEANSLNTTCEWVEDIDVTGLSIILSNLVSDTQLSKFVEGMNHFENLQSGDKILIWENDANTGDSKQELPNLIKEYHGDGIIIEYGFGKACQDHHLLEEYDLIVHGESNLINHQEIKYSLSKVEKIGIPHTIDTLILPYCTSKDNLERVLSPCKNA